MASFGYWVDWLCLGRVSAVPTAISNVMLGYLMAVRIHGTAFRWEELLLGIVASASLYIAGMMLNDVFDIEQDRLERPERPLPSGRIQLPTAHAVGVGLLISGMAITGVGMWCVNISHPTKVFFPLLVSVILVIAILSYDCWLKKSVLAPSLMGLCRFLNLLLGASFALPIPETISVLTGFDQAILFVAVSLGVYVAGITLVGRKEAVTNIQRTHLWLGTGLIVMGISGFTFADQIFQFSSARDQRLRLVFPWLMILMAFPVIRRSITAAIKGSPKTIQNTVISALRSIIVFDAALCFVAAPNFPGYALCVLSLLFPSLILSRWLKPT